MPLAVVLLLAQAAPASAIRYGSDDNGEHPYVGELFFFDPDTPNPLFTDPGTWFSCSGTLVSPTVVLTAGHCAYGIGLNGESTILGGDGDGGRDVWIDFSEAAHFDGIPPNANYGPGQQHQRYLDRVTWLNANPNWRRGTAHPHPEYANPPVGYHDAGVVVLDTALSVGGLGAIAPQGYLDRYAAVARSHVRFETVGYGVTRALPIERVVGDTRRKAEVKLVNLDTKSGDAFILVSNDPGGTDAGGLCFGDSGGPVFDNSTSNLIVALNSFVLNQNCAGIGAVYRIDEPDDLEFLAAYGVTP
jgi:hypothetical protein